MSASPTPEGRSHDKGIKTEGGQHQEWLDNDMYVSYSLERDSSTKVVPGRLNLSQFDNITDAVGRLNLSSQSRKGLTSALSSSHQSQEADESKVFFPFYLKKSKTNGALCCLIFDTTSDLFPFECFEYNFD